MTPLVPSIWSIVWTDNACYQITSIAAVVFVVALLIKLTGTLPGGRGKPDIPVDPEFASLILAYAVAGILFLSAIVCIVLGMGLPTVGVYVLLAALVAPSLIELGVKPIAAHLYVMYFGMMSMITPPIAIAAFAAASLAKADAMRTGFTATRFGWTAFIVPVLFVYSPSLLLIGDPVEVAVAFCTAVFGVSLVSCASVGFFMRPLGIPGRLLFAAAGIAALIPANAFPGGVLLDIIGVVAGMALIAYEYVTVTRARLNDKRLIPAQFPSDKR